MYDPNYTDLSNEDRTCRLIRNARFLLIDTNIVMLTALPGYHQFAPRFKELLQRNEKAFWGTQKHVLFPLVCLSELQKLLADPETASQAECALNYVIDLYSSGLLVPYNGPARRQALLLPVKNRDPGKKHGSARKIGDMILYQTANDLRLDGSVLVLTNDKDLASDLLNLNRIKSSLTDYNVKVQTVSPEGWLEDRLHPQSPKVVTGGVHNEK